MAIIWLTRLGTFLLMRIMKDGKDDRFTKLKTNAVRFSSMVHRRSLSHLKRFTVYGRRLAPASTVGLSRRLARAVD